MGNNKRKYLLEELQTWAHLKGGQCLENKNPENTTDKLLWECANKHQWLAPINSVIRNKSWCKKCAGLETLTIKDAKEHAQFNEGYCLSEKYINSREKLIWKCKNDHIWAATFNSVRRGHWCFKCKNKVKPINEIRKIIENKNGILHTNVYLNTKSKLKIECEIGHIWETQALNILSKNRWCPDCARNKPLNIDIMKGVAKERGGDCISEIYVGIDYKLQWKCINEHTWWATGQDVKNQGTWCPKCLFRTENMCRDILEKIFNVKFEKIRPDWLIGKSGKKLELDGFNENLKLAFEINGAQHYKIVKKFKMTEKSLEDIKERDKIKVDKCKENNIDLIVLNTSEIFYDEEKLKFIILNNEIVQKHLKLKEFVHA